MIIFFSFSSILTSYKIHGLEAICCIAIFPYKFISVIILSQSFSVTFAIELPKSDINQYVPYLLNLWRKHGKYVSIPEVLLQIA